MKLVLSINYNFLTLLCQAFILVDIEYVEKQDKCAKTKLLNDILN